MSIKDGVMNAPNLFNWSESITVGTDAPSALADRPSMGFFFFLTETCLLGYGRRVRGAERIVFAVYLPDVFSMVSTKSKNPRCFRPQRSRVSGCKCVTGGMNRALHGSAFCCSSFFISVFVVFFFYSPALSSTTSSSFASSWRKCLSPWEGNRSVLTCSVSLVAWGGSPPFSPLISNREILPLLWLVSFTANGRTINARGWWIQMDLKSILIYCRSHSLSSSSGCFRILI